MKRKPIHLNSFIVFCFNIMGFALICNAENDGGTKKIMSIDMPDGIRERVEAIYKAVNCDNWPKTNVLRTAPKIDKMLLSNPGLVTRELISYSRSSWVDLTVSHWDWGCVFGNPYRRKKAYDSRGQMDIELILASNQQTLYEILIYTATICCSLPTDSIINQFSESRRINDLGTIAYGKNNDKSAMIRFVRDNIGVTIRAPGSLFASEVLPLARKIDSLIQKQPVLSREQFIGRAPVVVIATDVEKVKADGIEGQYTIGYTVSAPAGQDIADLKAWVNGTPTSVKNGKIQLVNMEMGEVKVKITAITSELRDCTVEREFNISD